MNANMNIDRIRKSLNGRLWRLTLLGLLIVAPFATEARAQSNQELRGEGFPPTVTIGEVRQTGAGQFSMAWNARIPYPGQTIILGYIATLEVTFSNGASRIQSKPVVDATATSATFQLAQPSGAIARTFKATLDTRFRTRESRSISVTRAFDLRTDAFQGGVASGGNLPTDHPRVQIANVIPQSGFERYEVRWVAETNPNIQPAIVIQDFLVSAKITFVRKPCGSSDPRFTLQSPIARASANQRQATVQVDLTTSPSACPRRAEATVNTRFLAPVERTIQTVKEGGVIIVSPA